MPKVRARRSLTLMASLTLTLWLAVPALRAQICSGVSGGPILGEEPLNPTAGDPALNCNPFRCYDAILGSATYELVPPSCNPNAANCTVRARVETFFNGNDQNSFPFGTPARVDWNFSSGAFAGACGNASGALDWERGSVWLEVGNFRCDPLPVSGLFDIYRMSAISCPGLGGGCQRTRLTHANLTAPVIAGQLCPSPPPPWSCGEGDPDTHLDADLAVDVGRPGFDPARASRPDTPGILLGAALFEQLGFRLLAAR